MNKLFSQKPNGGFEPPTFALQVRRSTTELIRHKKTTPTRFELALPMGNGLAVRRLKPLGHGVLKR